MKKSILLLALIGISYSGTEAQTKNTETKHCKCWTSAKRVKSANGELVHHHHTTSTTKSGDTYQVCRENGGHYDCCTHHTKVVRKVTN